MGQRNIWCRHRTAFNKEIPTCKAGVDFHQFEIVYTSPRKGPSLMPCLGECPEAIARCPKFEGWTPEEIAAREADLHARFERIGAIRSAIVTAIKDTGARSGRIACPACKTGTVGYCQASNGHVHAKCSTPNCEAWME